MSGYSGKPVYQKLGIQTQYRIKVLFNPEAYDKMVGLSELNLITDESDLDFIHLFITSTEELWTHLPELRLQINPRGMIWVSWPKKISKLRGDVTEDIVRAAALSMDLVDVKVCALDETWSALKLVIPLSKRPRVTK